MSVSGVGFVNMTKGLIDMVVRAGRINAVQLLPDPTTVPRRTTKHADEI